MKPNRIIIGLACPVASLCAARCGQRIAGEKSESRDEFSAGQVGFRGCVQETPSGSHPLAMAAQVISQAMSQRQLSAQLVPQVCEAAREGRHVELGTVFADWLVRSRHSSLGAVDTTLLRDALAAADRPMILYPYWRQREIWSQEGRMSRPVVVVWCDPALPESDSVEGWSADTGERLMIKDGKATNLAVLVCAYPEFDGGVGGTTGEATLGEVYSEKSLVNPNCERLWQLTWIHMYDDHEPDWLEPPEFFVKANYGGGWEETSISPPVNNTSPWRLNAVYILDLGYSSWQHSKLEVLEDDWGSGDDLVEKYWDGSTCSAWIPLSEYEQRFNGCGSGDADVKVRVVAKNPS